MEEKIQQAAKIWIKYGEVINQKFGFDNYLIEANTPLTIFQNKNPVAIDKFIDYIEARIKELENCD